MRSNLQEKLTDRFLFLPSYIETQDGWYKLLFDLCENIEIKLNGKKYKNLFKVEQVKQKYGQLRFYTNICENNNMYNNLVELIENFEERSLGICEFCGENGKTIWENRWAYVKCEKCQNKEGKTK